MKTPDEMRAYKARWYQQNKLKRPEDKRVFDLSLREYIGVSGIYKLYWGNCEYYYFGQSINLSKRCIGHQSHLRLKTHDNKKLQRVTDKYGLPKWKVMIICNHNLLDYFELQFIKSASGHRKNCNIREETPTSNRGIKWSEETRKGVIQKRIKSGAASIIYVYRANTGEFITQSYSQTELIELLRLPRNGSGGICGVLNGKNKTYYGYHFSRQPKTKKEVLLAIVPDYHKEPYREWGRQRMLGSLNPMFGKKRPDVSGVNNPFRKLVASGYVGHKKPKKVKIPESQIIAMKNEGMSVKQIAELAGCGICNINLLLRKNGIFQGKGANRWKKVVA